MKAVGEYDEAINESKLFVNYLTITKISILSNPTRYYKNAFDSSSLNLRTCSTYECGCYPLEHLQRLRLHRTF